MSENVSTKKNNNRSSETSRIFASTPDDEIVISGMAGRYPSCDNVDELRENLFNKVDMLTDKNIRWNNDVSQETPRRKGVINNLRKFDASFFGFNAKLCNAIDPQGRHIIECAYEAIMDAGIHPQSLRNTKTGVFLASFSTEAGNSYVPSNVNEAMFELSSHSRSLLANRISYCLGLLGPSSAIDTACSSGLYALDAAFTALRTGQCENALVCGTNLLLSPNASINFYRLGFLSKDGYSRVFDEKASGYVRSESICALFLQKVRNAKRIYAKVVYTNVNCDGYKDEGNNYPSSEKQEQLLRDFYKDLELDPRAVSYVEAHGTGTRAGDPEECRALDRIFCTNRKEPMLIGSVKSNIGHTEASSGICSITKVVLSFEQGAIPPNLHFEIPRQEIAALVEGRMKVCTEITPLPGSLAAVNSFGFGGANAHALLARFEKEKSNFGIPDDSISRLVFWAGRTKEAVDKVFDSLESKPLDAEFIGLLHNIQKYEQAGHLFRGYTILEKGETESDNKAKCKNRVIVHCDVVKRPVVWIFTGMGSQWIGMATSLMQLDLFRESIYKCHEILKPYGLDLISILTSTDKTTFHNILHSFVGIAAIQIAIVDILLLLDVPFDYCIGHSVGELGCAYADGTLTAEQMIQAVYARGLVSTQTEVIHGSMAAVGLSYSEIKDMVPQTIEIACHNSCNSSTISGPKEDVSKFVAELKSKGIFAKEVSTSNIPYHSKYIAEMGPKFLKVLKDLIPQPVRRTEKWISSSVPKENWNSELGQFSSAEYHTNNLLSPVLFEEATKNLPEDAITIEIAPHGLLQAVIKKCLPNGVHIPLTDRGNEENLVFFFGALGKLFLNGFNLSLERLYPATSYPVSRGTQSISPLILWDHSLDWFCGDYDEQTLQISCEKKFSISITEDDYKYIQGHVIDGRMLYPATSYLHLVRYTAVNMTLDRNFNALDIEFENVQFLRATILSGGAIVRLTVVIHIGSGAFEVNEGSSTLITGTVKVMKGEPIEDSSSLMKSYETTILEQNDFYKELRLRGYQYTGLFKSVVEAKSDGSMGKIKWQDNWSAFMDCMLQTNIIRLDSRLLFIPTSIQKIRINTERHLQAIAELGPKNCVLDVRSIKELDVITCGGIEMKGITFRSISRRRPPNTEVLESYEFVPFNCDLTEYQKNEAVSIFVQINLENLMQYKLKIVEIDESEAELKEVRIGEKQETQEKIESNEKKERLNTLIQVFDDVIVNTPMMTADLLLLSKKKTQIKHVTVENTDLKDQTNCHFIIASNWLKDSEKITLARRSLIKKGFLILREDRDIVWNDIKYHEGFNLISIIKVPGETLILLQRTQPIENKSVVNIDSNDVTFGWLEPLKESIKNGMTIVVERNSASGLIGLVNCIRREPNCSNLVRGVLIDDKTAPQFDSDHPMYAQQLNLNLAMNVYKNGRWGTYRHLELKKDANEGCQTNHCFAHMQRIGDLSSFEWMTGWLNTSNRKRVVNIHYSAINFRDVVLATGRLPIEVIGTNRLNQQCFLGLEYSGVKTNGERIMGMVEVGAIATHTEYSPKLTWRVSDAMSLREAATIPVVYSTVYYAFFFYRPISKGKSILIHAGSGGIGLAAIRIALAYGMEVYTTCSTEEKKKIILEQFPQLKEENIGNSRDCSFEFMIRARTNGKGVDYVLNSLAKDKLDASVRCLGRRGVFLEISKVDIMANSKLDMAPFAQDIVFRSITTKDLFDLEQEREIVQKMIQEDLDCGIIQPLPPTVFQVHELEKAFRYMSSGKHVGKVLIQIRENETTIASMPMQVSTKIYFDPDMVYIILGGLGGFGLELADWMMLRGCRKLVLSSRNGIKTGYQEYRINIWESYGCKVIISTADITTHHGCKNLIVESLAHGAIGGIFNLAVVFNDGNLESQRADKFLESFGPKVFATQYLDELSRTLCPNLKYFVVFSSVICGRGHTDQTIYGMSNSVIERIIEKRARDDLPGKAIQWASVGDVGRVAQIAENNGDLCIAGTVQQRISSCLYVLDSLLLSNIPIVSSMVVAEKLTLNKANLLQSVSHIMGFKDLKSISKYSTLAENGMDSMMAVEIRQITEHDFGINMTVPELRALTFEKLQELSDSIGNVEPIKPFKPHKSEHRQLYTVYSTFEP